MHPLASVSSGFLNDSQKRLRGKMIRAGTGYKDSSSIQELEGPQIDLLVTSQGRLQDIFRFGESRGIEDYEIEPLPLSLQRPELVEGISHLELAAIRETVESSIFLGQGDGLRRDVDSQDRGGPGPDRL